VFEKMYALIWTVTGNQNQSPPLSVYINFLIENPNVNSLIACHTDNIGSAVYNMRFGGVQRASKCMQAIFGEKGIGTQGTSDGRGKGDRCIGPNSKNSSNQH